jgi:hypothetical protein
MKELNELLLTAKAQSAKKAASRYRGTAAGTMFYWLY